MRQGFRFLSLDERIYVNIYKSLYIFFHFISLGHKHLENNARKFEIEIEINQMNRFSTYTYTRKKNNREKEKETLRDRHQGKWVKKIYETITTRNWFLRYPYLILFLKIVLLACLGWVPSSFLCDILFWLVMLRLYEWISHDSGFNPHNGSSETEFRNGNNTQLYRQTLNNSVPNKKHTD